jgi:hypothetical protein
MVMANGGGNAGEGTAVKGTEVAGVPVSTDSTAPALVWPPSDEDLDDWHVIPLQRPNPAAAAAAATDGGGANGNGAHAAAGWTDTTGTTGTPPRKPLPAWLANHRAAKSGGTTTTGTIGAPTLNLAPRPATSAPGSTLRAFTPSPLEDTARLPSETTTAISAVRRPPAPASAEHGSALSLAPAAQPAVARPVATFPADRRRPAPQPAPAWNGVARRTAIVVLALLAAGQAAYIGARLLFTPAAASTSVLTVDSSPDGAEVVIDGELRGVTPFKVELPAGAHDLQLRKNGRTRTIPVVLAAGVQASQYVELGGAAAPAPAPSSGSAGSAGPAGASGASAQPSGTPRQAAPPASASPSLESPAPSDGISGPAAADASAPPPGSSRGWVVIESGLNLRVLRNGEMLGSSEEGRLALPAGRQELELVNDAVGYRAVMTVQVPPGRAVPVPVELPQSVLNVSSTPSARVWVDGREIGTTPISQLALPVGQHEVRFEHPEHGERRMTVLVRVGATTQAAVDFTR